MFIDNMSEIFAPMQIMVVLVFALLLFGPKRLPELGKQLGTALRDLNKAKGELMKHMSLDHEPDHEPANYTYPSDQSYTPSYMDNVQNVDLTDYTIAGKELKLSAATGTVEHGKSYEELSAAASADYNIVAPKSVTKADTTTAQGGGTTTAAV